ncbi:hypothetical protein [Micromonospora sp. IBSANI012]|uniref:hypothetical protein n=1 Tax=Micromonospora sp. IBSANI012 TaxID=3457761 RepID=UPI004057D8D9
MGAVHGGDLHVFVRSAGRVRLTRYTLTTGTWSTWTAVPAPWGARETPEAVGYGGELRLFVSGARQRVYQHRLGS